MIIFSWIDSLQNKIKKKYGGEKNRQSHEIWTEEKHSLKIKKLKILNKNEKIVYRINEKVYFAVSFLNFENWV